ncbi:MAG: stage sporulation protein [Clostridia bacterium]|jgi:stage III sporulation protein AH|uniref:SpoIIIAH-like family protein n=1 Tax=Petroclostridium xylanilyticum TaxID=1792311 RepID=UPI000B98FD21|nr:SpoIIIAH-like family protein [Petroclostridium xylanilyticum]MBZ4644739.1 stage sporulation protein [Clostridia bacterium]
MLVIKKRQVVIIALIIMILVAGYLNWSYKKDMESVPTISQDTEASSQKNLGEAKLVNGNLEAESSSMEQQDQKVVVDTGSSNKYFLEARMQKESTRSEALELLQSIVNDQNSPKESKTKAQNEVIKMAKAMETEAIIENLIKAKGFKDTAVFINEGNVNVVVQSDGLIPSQVAQIQDIVVTQTGIAVEKIKIVEVK